MCTRLIRSTPLSEIKYRFFFIFKPYHFDNIGSQNESVLEIFLMLLKV